MKPETPRPPKLPEQVRDLVARDGGEILEHVLGAGAAMLAEPAVLAYLARRVAPGPGEAERLLAAAIALLHADRRPAPGAPS